MRDEKTVGWRYLKTVFFILVSRDAAIGENRKMHLFADILRVFRGPTSAASPIIPVFLGRPTSKRAPSSQRTSGHAEACNCSE